MILHRILNEVLFILMAYFLYLSVQKFILKRENKLKVPFTNREVSINEEYIKYGAYLFTIFYFESLILFLVYSLIIINGSITFGIYYVLHKLWPKDYINSFIDASALRSLALLIKYSLNNFYNFPTDKLLCIMGIVQYYIGKFLDIFVLGYVFTIIGKKLDDLKPNQNRNLNS